MAKGLRRSGFYRRWCSAHARWGHSRSYLLLDWEDREPTNGDLVVVESPDKKKYVRRQVHQLPLGPEAKVRHCSGYHPTLPQKGAYRS